jgi:hypothetical protein
MVEKTEKKERESKDFEIGQCEIERESTFI